jgi:GNAT superfamily N-acetyltransferase
MTELINTAYGNESRIWKIQNKQRTTIPEITNLIAASEILAAFSNSPSEDLIGCIQLYPIDPPQTAGLGMLAVAYSARGKGVGRLLVEAAEERARGNGFTEMQLAILMPRDWKLEVKEVLKVWYERMGYVLVREGTLGEFYPELVELLACECKYVIHRKGL